jgi:hypothetical protein
VTAGRAGIIEDRTNVMNQDAVLVMAGDRSLAGVDFHIRAKHLVFAEVANVEDMDAGLVAEDAAAGVVEARIRRRIAEMREIVHWNDGSG